MGQQGNGALQQRGREQGSKGAHPMQPPPFAQVGARPKVFQLQLPTPYLQVCVLVVVDAHQVVARLSGQVGDERRLARAGGALQQHRVLPVV